jgi:hypothetical protein
MYQVADAMHDGLGLACPCPCHDQKWAVSCEHCLALGVIEAEGEIHKTRVYLIFHKYKKPSICKAI